LNDARTRRCEPVGESHRDAGGVRGRDQLLGLVLPPASGSKRDAKVTAWPVIVPLLVRSKLP
jgi:hypothetical protein